MSCMKIVLIALSWTVVLTSGRPGFLPQFIQPLSGVGSVLVEQRQTPSHPYVVQPLHFLPKNLFVASPPPLQAQDGIELEQHDGKEMPPMIPQDIPLNEGPSINSSMGSGETRESTTMKNHVEDTLTSSVHVDKREEHSETPVNEGPLIPSKNQQPSVLASFSYLQPTLSWSVPSQFHSPLTPSFLPSTQSIIFYPQI